MSQIRVGVAGAAGYTGGELLRLLIHHPQVSIAYAQSSSHAGQPWHAVHRDLLGYASATFTKEGNADVDVLFLCQGHGKAKAYFEAHPQPDRTKIIDLSHDFRLAANAEFAGRQFVYGLPELQREAIQQANAVANPGCFATAIQLGLLPLAKADLLPKELHIQATTGSTGAGQALSETGHFSRRHANLSVYKAFTHQHLGEIGETLASLGSPSQLHFVPIRGAFTRGILAAASLTIQEPLKALMELYQGYYKGHPFTHISPYELELKTVINTNFCYVSLEKVGDQLLIVSAIDNLLKGASGQAVQNMNLMLGLPENTGLQLKALAY